jgi:hypothetical protein
VSCRTLHVLRQTLQVVRRSFQVSRRPPHVPCRSVSGLASSLRVACRPAEISYTRPPVFRPCYDVDIRTRRSPSLPSNRRSEEPRAGGARHLSAGGFG